ncbi:hypothetical protein T492DRAFT_1003305 [Pavlovales sp. CCMP2436]|nr:hypothetical protein T492DRAFT_1003305 [Pavlovales sp. CCMP2436]
MPAGDSLALLAFALMVVAFARMVLAFALMVVRRMQQRLDRVAGAATRSASREGWLSGLPGRRRGCRGLGEHNLGEHGVALIDVNNVRGKLGFARATLAPFCGALARWALDERILGRVIAAIDHGPSTCALSFFGFAITFSGESETADDAIVRDVAWLAERGCAPITVVTSDRLLRQRCHAAFRDAGPRPAVRGSALRLVSSAELANALEAYALADWRTRPAPGWKLLVAAEDGPSRRASISLNPASSRSSRARIESTEDRVEDALDFHKMVTSRRASAAAARRQNAPPAAAARLRHRGRQSKAHRNELPSLATTADAREPSPSADGLLAGPYIDWLNALTG